jgi:hypothetical protein
MDQPATVSFAYIKRRLDPRTCYLIIENTAEHGRLSDFDCVRATLDPFGADILEQVCYRDDTSKNLLLVVSLAPDRAEEVKEHILNCNRPDDIVVYFYGNSLAGEGPLPARAEDC